MPDSQRRPQSRPPKGVDLGEALVLFAHEKLVFTNKAVGTREHLTVHFGPASKVVDVHKTYTAADGTKTHDAVPDHSR